MVVIHMPRYGRSVRTRSVRLDREAERALAEIQRLTGASISDALKRGLLAAERELRSAVMMRPYDIYKTLDIGPGGYSYVPSSPRKRRVAEIVRRKHRR